MATKLETSTLWIARILSLAIILFWGYFTIAHIIGSSEPQPQLATSDYFALTFLAATILGLAIAWKWQLAGACISLVSFTLLAIINWKVLLFPSTLIPVTGLLFLIHWYLINQKNS